jgi:hypothetical protein
LAAIVIAGIWVGGSVLTNDFRLPKLRTALWVGVAGLAAPASRNAGSPSED